MAGYQGFDGSQTSQLMYSTLANHMTKVEEAVSRNYRFPALLQDSGRIVTNSTGNGITWPVHYRHLEVEANNGKTPISYAPNNVHLKAELPNDRGFLCSDAIFDGDVKKNSGKEAIIKLVEGFAMRMESSVRDAMAKKMFQDGNATGNTSFYHGFESMFGATQTIDITQTSTTTARTADAADYVMYPNDTYAGISTVLGTQGGANAVGSVWPEGLADSQFDFWSPVIVAWDSTSFNGSAETFYAQGYEALTFAQLAMARNDGADSQPTIVLMARDLFTALKRYFADKQEIHVLSGSQAGQMQGLGFNNNLYVNGMEIGMDNAIQGGVAYGFNPMQCELHSVYPTLLHAEQEDFYYDPPTQQHRGAVKALGNLKFANPRSFFKLVQAT